MERRIERKIKRTKLYFLLAVIFSVLLAATVALIYPADMRRLSEGSSTMALIVGIAFWVLLVLLMVMQAVYAGARIKTEKFILKRGEKLEYRRPIFGRVFSTVPALVSAALFAAGAALTTIRLLHSTLSSAALFFSIALAVLGLTGYINFNSKTYRFIQSRKPRKQSMGKKRTEEKV